MKKNDFNSNQEFEKLLKEKMNELSTSVDCFDRISARAFPEKDSDFSDCGLTVSDLENVTGKRRVFPVLRWVSAAAAIVLCISIIPKTALINSLRNSMENRPEKHRYSKIISEIKKETETGSYYICDLSLDDYISRDVLVTPLYSCPFEENDEDMNVRIFVKTIGGLRTNQIYAVEYRGTYSENNIVAAAESGVKFSKKEMADLETDFTYYYTSENETVKAVATAFSDGGTTSLSDVSAASFSDFSFYKSGKNVASVQTDVIYYRYNDSNEYYYDIKTTDNTGSEMTISRDSWKNVACIDDNDTVSTKNSGAMTKVDLFTGNYEITNEIWYFTPSGSYLPNDTKKPPVSSDYVIEQHNSYNMTGDVLSRISFPMDSTFQRSLNIYLGKCVPAAVYPDTDKEQAQYYSTLNMTSVYDGAPSANQIQVKIDVLSSDQLLLDQTEQDDTFSDDEHAAFELERQKIQREINRLNDYLSVLKAQDEMNRQQDEKQKRQDMLEAEQNLQDMLEAERNQLEQDYESYTTE